MSFLSRGGLRLYQFDSFGPDVFQAVFTRRGGVSPEPWNSLNLGSTVGDDLDRVRENRMRAFAAADRDPASLFDVWQVHGVDVAIAEVPHPPGSPHQQADIILTDKPGLTLLMRFADCVPILLHDPVRKAAGIAHAGWLGTVRGTARVAVEAMRSRYGSDPADILAAIGPSIGPDHYEVGTDVVIQVRQAFGQDASGLLASRDGHAYLDLWAANRLLLEQAGVRQVETSGLCTACALTDWYSHRLEKGRTGRFGAMIALKS
jgi:YfiH family protein